MQPRRAQIIVTISLLFSAWGATAVDDDGIPGGRIAVASLTPLKPLLNNQDGIKLEERRESVLRGLLEVRQSFCPSGYGQCTTGVCCQLNGGCCSNNTCCGPHQRCCQVGCCDLSDYCVIDPVTGRRGCCPLGETCSGVGNTCTDSGYFPCQNDDFCCPFGTTCFRDSKGNGRCRNSGSNPAPTTRRTTTSLTTSKKVTFSTQETSTKVVPPTTRTSSTENFPTTTQVPDISPTVYPTPVPSSGTQTVIVGVTDPRILWIGSTWTLGTSSCNSTAQSKKISAIGSAQFEADPGTSVYLTLSAYNVVYEVKVNDRRTTYRETSILNDCKLTWSSGILTTRTEIVVTVLGPTSLPNERRQLSDPWSFEFHNFVMTMPSTSSSASSGSVNPSGFIPPTSSTMGLKVHLALYTGLVIGCVVSFGSFRWL